MMRDVTCPACGAEMEVELPDAPAQAPGCPARRSEFGTLVRWGLAAIPALFWVGAAAAAIYAVGWLLGQAVWIMAM